MNYKKIKSNPYSLFQLADNFQAVFWPAGGVETVLVSLWVRSGGWYETKVKRGVFHFLEHVLAQGTKSYPSYFELASKQEELGISVKNTVRGYFSRYNWSVPKETFADSLSLLSEYVFAPLLPKEGIERERKIIAQEYFDVWDKPGNIFSRRIDENLFGNAHPYTLDALGTKKSIETITKEDLVGAHEQYYQLNNMILGVVGDLKKETVEAQIKKSFSGKSSGRKITLDNDEAPDFKRKVFFLEKNVDQLHFSLNFPTFGFTKETLKEKNSLLMLSYLLGRSRVSRLNLRLREKEPLSYSIGSSVKAYPQIGIFKVDFASSLENFQRVIEIIKEEIEAIKKGNISEKQFSGCQKQMIYKVSLSFDTIYAIADNVMDSLGCKGRIILPEEKKEAILKITKDDILTMAGEIFDFNKATIGFMGNKDDLERIKTSGVDKII